MKQSLCAILIAYGCAVTYVSAHAAGFESLQVTDHGQPDLQVGVWYPTKVPPASEPNTEFGLAVALDAPLQQANGALVVISHGYSGWYAGHADTAAALADAGFIVAAPSHTGNTWSDMSSSPDKWVLDRPRHISKVIDHMLNNHRFAKQIDKKKIGVYGFSAGGYTALGLVGGVPDFNEAAQHCKTHPQEYVCADGLIGSLQQAGLSALPPRAWGYDPRIGAAVMSAPGLAFAYSKDSLSRVHAKVQLWSGQLDDSVPTETNAALLAARLPATPETYWIDGASHFAFMTVACRESFKRADPQEYQMVCGDSEGFDRYRFHDDMHVEMVRFYRQSLNIPQ
ncbi:MAG: dienelactone hydrolase family protein [Pseudomonadota bacterium]